VGVVVVVFVFGSRFCIIVCLFVCLFVYVQYCLESGLSYTFEMTDGYGDGLCCDFGSGGYTEASYCLAVEEGLPFGPQNPSLCSIVPPTTATNQSRDRSTINTYVPPVSQQKRYDDDLSCVFGRC
jgi:hypothetical protein